MEETFWQVYQPEGEGDHHSIEEILERTDFSNEDERLEALLDFDECITECKNLNAALIYLYDFLFPSFPLISRDTCDVFPVCLCFCSLCHPQIMRRLTIISISWLPDGDIKHKSKSVLSPFFPCLMVSSSVSSFSLCFFSGCIFLFIFRKLDILMSLLNYLRVKFLLCWIVFHRPGAFTHAIFIVGST